MMVTTTRGLRSVKRALGVSWSALHAESGPAGPLGPCGAIGAIGTLTGLTLTLSESEVSWGEVSEEDIIPLTR